MDVAPSQSPNWQEAAAVEHASIASFAQLTLDLMALGAPLELLERSLKAALEELEHTKKCLAIHAAESGCEAAPEDFAPTPQLGFSRRLDTVVSKLASRWAPHWVYLRLGEESWRDGYLNENAAADFLERQAQSDGLQETTRTLLREIAAEERAHAQLGFDIARWCEDQAARHRGKRQAVRAGT